MITDLTWAGLTPEILKRLDKIAKEVEDMKNKRLEEEAERAQFVGVDEEVELQKKLELANKEKARLQAQLDDVRSAFLSVGEPAPRRKARMSRWIPFAIFLIVAAGIAAFIYSLFSDPPFFYAAGVALGLLVLLSWARSKWAFGVLLLAFLGTGVFASIIILPVLDVSQVVNICTAIVTAAVLISYILIRKLWREDVKATPEQPLTLFVTLITTAVFVIKLGPSEEPYSLHPYLEVATVIAGGVATIVIIYLTERGSKESRLLKRQKEEVLRCLEQPRGPNDPGKKF